MTEKKNEFRALIAAMMATKICAYDGALREKTNCDNEDNIAIAGCIRCP
jgi:hypothetical protein